jgi:hypothetical protein
MKIFLVRAYKYFKLSRLQQTNTDKTNGQVAEIMVFSLHFILDNA